MLYTFQPKTRGHFKYVKLTRMHSSRMHTARSSSRHGGSPHPHGSRHPPPEQAPQVWAWRPPPKARPLNFPPGCGPGNLQGMLGYHPPETCYKACWDTTCNACWDNTPSPVDRMTDTCKNITFANFVCGR